MWQKVIPEEGCCHHQIPKSVVLALRLGGRGQGNTYRISKHGDTICYSATVGKWSPAVTGKMGNTSNEGLAEMP